MKPSAQQIKKFQKTVWDYYHTSGRGQLPWRTSINPYRIWVSEIMLQQTQVDRVINFFKLWMKSFPTIQKLAQASQVDVLKHWKGLGYNSRALRMKQAAGIIMKDYRGKFPTDYQELKKLPGIGPYTAGAICAFANNQPVVLIETNIRRVFIYHFFQTMDSVHDEDILKLIEKTVDQDNPREWYWALMDYGSFLGRTLNSNGKKYNPNQQSKHYTKQKKFTGSDRQIRGKILEFLLKNKKTDLHDLINHLQDISKDTQRIEKVINQLEREGFTTKNKNNSIFLKK